jgi:aminoglycoside phosphotransferase (APT) family kinase protein
MAALHALPVEDCLAWGVPERDRTDVLLSAFDRVLPELPAEDQAWARSWRSRFELGQFQAVVTHGDLWYENILIDADTHRLTAVIDFDTAGVGDPAWDLATQFHCGVEFAQLVFDAYGCEDPGMWWRAQQLLQLRQFEGLDWAIREGDDIELDESLEKLRCAGVLRETRTLQTKRRLAAP